MSNYSKDRNLLLDSILIAEQVETLCQIYFKDRNLLLGLISIARQVETLCQITLRTETCFLVQSQSPGRWKPYVKFT